MANPFMEKQMIIVLSEGIIPTFTRMCISAGLTDSQLNLNEMPSVTSLPAAVNKFIITNASFRTKKLPGKQTSPHSSLKKKLPGKLADKMHVWLRKFPLLSVLGHVLVCPRFFRSGNDELLRRRHHCHVF